MDLEGIHLLIINPKIHISTAQAFEGMTPNRSSSCQSIVKQEIATWKTDLVNDFEMSIFPKHPELSVIKEKLYSLGADYAAMSGSGSTLFGLFSNEIPTTEWDEDYFVWQTTL